MNTQNSGFGLILPALMNPATATVLAVGVLGYGLMKLFADNEGNKDTPSVNCSAEIRQPSKPPIKPSVVRQFNSVTSEQALHDTEVEPLRSAVSTTDADENNPPEIQVSEFEADRSELIRQYMSELGKRSAAARARKRETAGKLQIEKQESLYIFNN